MPRTPTETVAAARAEIKSQSAPWKGMCLKFARTCAGIPALYPDAITAWSHTRQRGSRVNAPAGAFVWWSIGQHGHVAVSTGDGNCVSTDIRRTGHADLVPISEIARKWGAKYLGWSWDCNGQSTNPTTPTGGVAGTPKESDVISDAQMTELKKASDDSARKWALWQVLWGLQTEDDLEAARAAWREAYDKARAAGKSEAMAEQAGAVASDNQLRQLREQIQKDQKG